MFSPMALARRETQTASVWIRTQGVDSVFYDGNRYAKYASNDFACISGFFLDLL